MAATGNGHGPAAPGPADTLTFVHLFENPALVASLRPDALPSLLVQIASGLIRLCALQNAVAARLLTVRGPIPTSQDVDG